MTSVLMMIAELLVAVLLVACMVTCAKLGRRIARLQADEASMRRTIGDLVQATENAERAISGLRATLGECDRTLADRLRTAERYAADLASQVEAGESMMGRIMQIVDSSRRAAAAEPAPRMPEPRMQEPAPAPRAPEPRIAEAPRRPPFMAPPRSPEPVVAARPAEPPRSARISAAAEILAERAARRLGRG
ncbi:DUF6468 domain-containing protein [Salinarimonas ramus]|uniref:DUF6468 domain-containing protein n=1 Tax=Salinarimonas ramus TaxID=690164 RepID=A0A917QI12_9HYPH|nr:DUF6468 domain-containing protein [Salinarimonas ramus]GGK52243.1 hypothetical protein GCM10011322_43990 [Salinarimonas ramus]